MQLKNCLLIEPLVCRETESVVEVGKKLRAHTIRHIYVVDAKDSPVGLISVTDINNRVVAEGKDPSLVLAKEIMTRPIESFDLHADVDKVYHDMVAKNRVTVPVVEHGKLKGILTIHHILAAVEKKQ